MIAGFGEAPLGTSAGFFPHFWSVYLNNFNTICWCVRKKEIVLSFVVENNNLRLYARASEASERLINIHTFKSQRVTFLYELLLTASAISTIILFCHQ